MISLVNQELLAQAIDAVRARRETQAAAAQTQAAVDKAQGLDMQKTRLGAAVKLAGAKGAKGKTAGKTKTASKTASGPTQPGSQDITPYLESGDLMAMADRGQADDTAVADTNFAYEVAAANAIRQSGDVERGRVQNVAGVNDDTAGRGLYYSGIRQGGVGMANANAARGQADIQGSLAMDKAKQQTSLAGVAQGRAEFQQAMVARAAENGMALPVDPYGAGASPARAGAAQAQRNSPGQNGAVNAPGAATVARKPGSVAGKKTAASAKGFGLPARIKRAGPLRRTRPAASKSTMKAGAR